MSLRMRCGMEQEAPLSINENGRVVIPAAFRKALGIKVGDEVVLRVQDGELRITTQQSRIQRAQRRARQYVEPGGMSLGMGNAERLGQGYEASAQALSDIPPTYLRLYRQAAARYRLDWTILAGIGKVECDHGRDPDPACTQEGAVNSAGAGGPMQFIASTWQLYGVDGDGDGRVDRWDPADAIYSAANYLHASGAPQDYGRAILAYNHAGWYVAEVEQWARRYRGASAGPASAGGEGVLTGVWGADVGLAGQSPTPVRFIGGERAGLAPGDGHLALVPAGVPATVQAMVVAGNELQDLPYGPGGHPDPRGATQEDCSSTINYVLY